MPPTTPQLEQISKRVCWSKPVAEALEDEVDFLCRVMTWGTWDDVVYVLKLYSEDKFREAMLKAPIGIFDPPSWHYWHYRFGMRPVPPLPQRFLDKPVP